MTAIRAETCYKGPGFWAAGSVQDLHNAYEHINFALIWEVAGRTGFPLSLMAWIISLYSGPRLLMLEGVVMGSPLWPVRGGPSLSSAVGGGNRGTAGVGPLAAPLETAADVARSGPLFTICIMSRARVDIAHVARCVVGTSARTLSVPWSEKCNYCSLLSWLYTSLRRLPTRTTI